MNKAISDTDIKPPTKPKRKRKVRSDKGKKRGGQIESKQIKSKVTQNVSKYLFDEHVINGQWYMQVKDNFASRSLDDAYVIEFMLDGVRYTYKKYYADPTLAYTVGSMYLDHRYKNKGMYQ